MRKLKGFSLIELLLVVAVIMILAAIAVPNFMRAKMAANESSAVASLHNIDTAQVAYQSTYPTEGFAPDLNTLGPGAIAGNSSATSTNALLLDNVLGCPAGVGTASCQKSGYTFSITAGTGTPINTYKSNANPTSPGQTGTRYFYSDNSDVIRFNNSTTATVNDQTIQ
jgi:prepilin-type N-terminal cleavage/methylation domain-containing protein